MGPAMAAAPAEPGGMDGYLSLRDVRVEMELGAARGCGEGGTGGCGGGGGGFAVCFWLYLSGSARPSSVILQQITAGDHNKLPFLSLSEGNKLLLFPLCRLHKEAPTTSSYPWADTASISAVNECPTEKWIHIGCEVTENVMRLHIDGDLVAEAHLCSLSSESDNQEDAYQICLVGNDDKVEGYVYNIQALSMLGTIHEQYVENPPSKLSIDHSCCDGIEEGDGGICCIVGGKASCRRNFIMEVVLTNAFGELVNKDTQDLNTQLKADLFQFSVGVHYLSSRYLSYLLYATISFSAFISLHFTCKNILFWRHLPNQFVVYLKAAPTVQWVLESGQVLQQLMKFTQSTIAKGLVVMAK